MAEEEVRALQSAFADLQRAFHELKAGYNELQELVKQKDQRIEELESQLLKERLRNLELEKRLAKDSHNSSKPPSSDGYRHQTKRREKSTKNRGGQAGHPGHFLAQVPIPDQVIEHRPHSCQQCHERLPQMGGVVKERRQLHDVPPLRLQVTEHQVVEQTCQRCGAYSQGEFPAGVDAAAQYGPNAQALAVYLSQFQLLPLSRIRELFADWKLGSLSEGSLVNWVSEAAERLQATQETLQRLLIQSRVAHVDETGGRIGGVWHWFHVVSSQWMTIYHWHRQRGQEATKARGWLPLYTGRLVHDRRISYDSYCCQHSLCGAQRLA